MSNIIQVDWRKRAAQQSMGTEDAEASFADLAYTAIQSKAAPLMKNPYRVGFEIVFKNDDNTRMVGIFVFRVGKELFYAPVFFINGAIKGTDLLYRHNIKRFVPLTNPWVDYLLALCESTEGQGVSQSLRGELRNQLKLHELIRPTNVKFGSASDETKAVWAEMEKQPELRSNLLREFIEQDGGFSAMRKIATACENDPEFADALVATVPAENYRPDLEAQIKEAATVTENLVTVYTGLLFNDQVKQASAEDLKRGYIIEDRRKEADFSEVAYAPASEILESINNPGIYEVLREDGTTAKMLAAVESLLPGRKELSPCGINCDSDYRSEVANFRIVLVDLNTHNSDVVRTNWKQLHGKYVRDLKLDEPEGNAKPSAGHAYRVLNLKAQTLSEPITVTKVENDGGLDKVFYVRAFKDDKCEEPLILNPDYPDYDPTDRILGSCCKFIEIASETESAYIHYQSDLNLGDAEAMRRFVFEAGYKQASVIHDHGAYIVETDGRSPRLSKLAATIGLMSYCGMSKDMADEVLTKAATDRQAKIYYLPHVKEGYQVNFNQWPELEATYNNEYNTLEEPRISQAIRADQVRPEIPRHRVGDILPVGGAENGDSADLSTMAPMDIYNLSKEKGTSAMFEHGVVGSLVQTYDSMAMVDKYMPDLEQGLDKLGRLLFLFYWKPEDFSRAYGTDDQTQLENKLSSCFKSLGDLVIELLRKNRDQDGTASLV